MATLGRELSIPSISGNLQWGHYVKVEANNFTPMLMIRNEKRYLYIFTRLSVWRPVKSFRDEQEARQGRMMKDFFKVKQAFAKERGGIPTPL